MMSENEFWIQLRYKIGWIVLAVTTVIPMVRWGMLGTAVDHFGTGFAVFSSLGKLTAIAGLMLYALNLVLAARLRIFEDYFGGLNRVYIAHHITGGIALVLLCFHPLFIAMRLIEWQSLASFRDAAKFLWPRAVLWGWPKTTVELQNLAINNGILAFLGMVVLLVLTFFVKLPYRIWLYTHKFLGVAFILSAVHLLYIKSDTSTDGFLRYYLLVFVVLGLAAYVYRTLAGSILVRKYRYHVDEVHKNGDVVELVMRPVGTRMTHQPGQFVFIRFKYANTPGVTTEAHPFSISSGPDDDFLRLDVKALGDYTRALVNIVPGAIAEVEGAYGKFSYVNYDNPRQVWIGGGIGITPFLSMARSLDKHKDLQVDLVYSVKSAAEFVHFDDLSQMVPKQAKNFKTVAWVADERGFLTADGIEKELGSLKGRDFYICGPPIMMKSLREQLVAKGIENWRIHSEEFSMS
jgi:predicted ferric reductase